MSAPGISNSISIRARGSTKFGCHLQVGLHGVLVEGVVQGLVLGDPVEGPGQERVLVLADGGDALVEGAGGQLLRGGVGDRLQLILHGGLPSLADDQLAQPGPLAVVAVVAEEEVRLQQHGVLVLFRRPVVDELLQGGQGALEGVAQPGGKPGQVDLGEEGRLHRQEGARGELGQGLGVCPELVQGEVLVVGPIDGLGALAMANEELAQARLERWQKVCSRQRNSSRALAGATRRSSLAVRLRAAVALSPPEPVREGYRLLCPRLWESPPR